MKLSRFSLVAFSLAALSVLVFAGSTAGHVQSSSGDVTADHDIDGTGQKALLFAADGMVPTTVERFARSGVMPTVDRLMREGVTGENGLLQGFPPNTGVGWTTLASGAWPSAHGSTNNTFHRNGVAADFARSTSAFAPGIVQADTIQQAAERAGKTVVSVEWVASRSLVPALKGPVVDFRTFFSTRGVLVNFDLEGQPAGANAFGVSYQRTGQNENTVPPQAPYAVPDVTDAVVGPGGWSNVPAHQGEPKQAQFRIRNTAFPAADNVDRLYDLFVYDTAGSAAGYDHVLVVPSTAAKNGALQVANLARGDWQDVKLKLVGGRAGQTAGFYLKLIELSSNPLKFHLYFTSIARANATYNGCTYAPGCDAPLGFEDELAWRFPTPVAGDFAVLEGGLVDEDTYVEQGLKWKDAHWAYLRHIIQILRVKPDLLLVGNPVTDEFQHQFLGLTVPEDIDGDPNPYFDDVNGDGIKDNRLAEREGYLREAYREADQTLALARSLIGDSVPTFVTSDHGFAPQWYAINARRVLFEATVRNTVTGADVSLHGSGANATGNCGAAALPAPPAPQVSPDLAKACWAGGTVQIYVNPTLPEGITYEAVRTAAVSAFQGLADSANPGEQVISKVFRKEQLRDVDGTDALHPNRSGDVVVVSQPPYQFDAATPGVKTAFSQFFGQHGYLPDLVNVEQGVNMHATFVAAGRGIRGSDGRGDGGGQISGVRAIDVAPTIAYLMGIPGPQHAQGRILYGALAVGEQHDRRELTILDISDYHGQLVPFTPEASDFMVSGTPPVATPYGSTFAIGGAAFLKPWFDRFRSEAKDGSLTITAGDAVGATPPISAFFGDKPTIELMNLMGFRADGLGNHNFDVGEAYMRFTLKPLANFPYLSANIVDSAGRTPPEWSPSAVFNFRGAKLGLVGFSNEDIPLLTRPGALGPFHVENATAAVNAEAALLAWTDAVVAMGHHGATTSEAVRPEPYYAAFVAGGPAVDLADNVRNVDAVVGDHTDFQIISPRPNGVLLVENRSRGIRFTRLRLVVDLSEHQVVYKTADFHKPWNIGVTADPTIQARLDQLNAELRPILGAQVGTASVAIPRSDKCGRADGRLCESRIGNIVTDAMRTTYLTDFAITNSGGLRADLTCPATDLGDDFCPPYSTAPPPFNITRGQVLSVLPFGNVVATLSLNGAELKTMLENGVSQMPAANGRFPQVSGLCFTYDIQAAPGSRVTGAVRQAADGSCTGAPVDLTAASTYSLAENDFMADGGDGYPVFRPRITTREIMDETVADYIAANTPVPAPLQNRIVCADSNLAAPPACPTILP
jgi:2',3'-cyclic-nucleotide 2'-phosphodiesterase (5'-nucleotidase family)